MQGAAHRISTMARYIRHDFFFQGFYDRSREVIRGIFERPCRGRQRPDLLCESGRVFRQLRGALATKNHLSVMPRDGLLRFRFAMTAITSPAFIARPAVTVG